LRRSRDGWTSKSGTNHPPNPPRAAWTAAIGVAIEIELHLPVRLHDLAHLRLDEHLVVTHGRGRQHSEVRLRVNASKNGRLVETCLVGESAATILRYLEEFRPHGPHPTSAWLFPNRDHERRPRAKNGFSEKIANAIHKYAGVRMNVHAFRAFAAGLILDDRPHAIDDVRTVLGHSNFEVANRHYRRSNREAASRRLGESISNRRRRSKMTSFVTRLPLDFGNELRRPRS
jgi:integrase